MQVGTPILSVLYTTGLEHIVTISLGLVCRDSSQIAKTAGSKLITSQYTQLTTRDWVQCLLQHRPVCLEDPNYLLAHLWQLFVYHICNIKCRLSWKYSSQNISNAKNFNPNKKPITLFIWPPAPRVCSESGGQYRVLPFSLSYCIWWPHFQSIVGMN